MLVPGTLAAGATSCHATRWAAIACSSIGLPCSQRDQLLLQGTGPSIRSGSARPASSTASRCCLQISPLCTAHLRVPDHEQQMWCPMPCGPDSGGRLVAARPAQRAHSAVHGATGRSGLEALCPPALSGLSGPGIARHGQGATLDHGTARSLARTPQMSSSTRPRVRQPPIRRLSILANSSFAAVSA